MNNAEARADAVCQFIEFGGFAGDFDSGPLAGHYWALHASIEASLNLPFFWLQPPRLPCSILSFRRAVTKRASSVMDILLPAGRIQERVAELARDIAADYRD